MVPDYPPPNGYLDAAGSHPWFLAGAGLITGSVASYMGDRLWIGDNYRVIPPESPEQTPASVIASLAVGLAGVACAAYALMMHFRFLKA